MELTKRRFLAGIGSLAIASLAGCSEESDEFEGGNGNGDSSDGSSSDVELLSHEAVREDEGTQYESLYVRGEAKNVSGGELDYAEVEVKYFSGGSLVESNFANISGWSAGETWAFEVMSFEMGEDAREIDKYEIRAGTSL